MCPNHPDIILQNVCGEDTCPKCSEEYYLSLSLKEKRLPYNREDVEAYFASHLTHGNLEEFRERYRV